MEQRQKDSLGDRYGKEDPRFWGARKKLPDNYIARPTETHAIIIRFHHGGLFIADPQSEYIRGQVYEMEGGLDIDEISPIELGKLVNLIGYQSYKCLWYRPPLRDLSNELRPLNTDQEVIQFINDVKGHNKVDVYVEHLLDTPIIVEQNAQGEAKDVSEIEVQKIYVEGVGDESDDSGGDTEYRQSEFDGSEGDSVDEDYNVHGEEDRDSDGDISLDDSDYYEDWDWTSVLLEEPVKASGRQSESDDIVRAAITARNLEPSTWLDFEDEDGDSEDVDSPLSSEEEEGGKKKYPKFKFFDDADVVKFELGQIFTSAEQVRTAVKEYALQAKKNVYFAKNERMRIVVKCMEGCSFYLRVSQSSQSNYFQTVSLDATHTCHRTAKNRQAKTKWLAKKFMSTLRHTPNMKVKALVEEAKNRWGVVLSRHQCYRAQRLALEMIQGAVSEQYKHLRSYGEELLRSTVVIKSTLGIKGAVFERMYVCFNACKTAFAKTCRPLIGLDGCFLKGVYGGQLLSAIGKDGNNQMVPIANTMPEWQKAMENIKKLSEPAWRDMIEVPAAIWTRAAYSTYTCCDLQVNNMCEAFNRAILEYRDKPIISLVEGLKFYLTNRIVKQKELMLRYKGNLCPMIQQKLEKIKKDADSWSPVWSGDAAYALFEVSNNYDKYVVNLGDKSCSCRKWDLSGIPCCHVVACMWFNNYIPEDYVSPYYRKSTFLATYDHIILPCNGPKLWLAAQGEPINPPYLRRAPGRPKKQRRKANDEPRNPHRISQQAKTKRCKRCGKLGHNSRTCKGKTAADRVIPKGGNKTHTHVQQPGEGTSQPQSQGTSQATRNPVGEVTTQGATQGTPTSQGASQVASHPSSPRPGYKRKERANIANRRRA